MVKRKGGKEIAIIIGVIFAALLIAAVSVLFLGAFALLIIAGAGYGAWWLITSQNIEFEYSVTNGDIDIDQIVAQRKRRAHRVRRGTEDRVMQPYKPEEYVGRTSTAR